MTVEEMGEREWHDQFYAAHGRHTRVDGGLPQDKYYSITGSQYRHFAELAYSGCAGKHVLDYCCGTGAEAVRMATAGAHVTGVDISPKAVDIAEQRARAAGVQERARFLAASAEHTGLADDAFDLVYGQGSLHHLDLSNAVPEIVRVLQPTGRAVFSDPLAYNPVFNVYRRMTSDAHSPGEHRLTRKDLHLVCGRFRVSYAAFFSLTALAAVPLRQTRAFQPILKRLEALDEVLFKLPGCRWLAWTCILSLEGPIKS